jgi:hypothetical protein
MYLYNNYFGSIIFPAITELGLIVNKRGKSSIICKVALFKRRINEAKSVGEFVYVFVVRATKQPAVNSIDTSEGVFKRSKYSNQNYRTIEILSVQCLFH